MNTGRYPYFILNHWLSQPVIQLVINFYGVIPVISPRRNCDEFVKKS